MNAFRVQCETCQSWLKVRDEGFIGEVHACPKCGSMVLITLPSGAGEESATSPGPVVAAMGDTLVETEPPVGAPTAEPTSPPPTLEATAAASKGAPWALASGAAMLVATGALVVVFALGGEEQSPAAPSDPTVAAVETSEEGAVPDATAEAIAAEIDPAETPTQDSPAVEEPATDVPAVADRPAPPELPPNPPAEVEPPAERIALASPSMPTDPPADEVEPAEIDPLAIDLEEVEIVLRKGGAAPSRVGDASGDSLADADKNPAGPSLDERLAAAGQHAGVFVRRGPTSATTGPATGSALAALGYVVPAIELRDIPLDEALRLLGDVAGAPITIDPAALRQAGVAASKPIDVVGENVTIADALRTSLEPLRLGVAVEGPYATVVRLGADEVRTIRHKVSDLVAGDPEELVELLRTVGDLPADSSIVDGKLAVTAPLATHYDLVVLTERLRLARGLSPSTKYPRSLLSVEPSLKTLAPVLDRRTTFSFVEPTPLSEIVAYWRRVTGLSILVDWRALADIGYGPRTTVQCSVTNRPWRVALDGVLEGIGLTWGAADGQTLWITARDAAESPETIEFYPPKTSPPEGAISESDTLSGRVLVRALAIAQREFAEDSAVTTTAGLE